ncbi:MAG: HD-GYP domain-containing protein [Armatimonadetes bacterium]|nr:HD-GYP domain-containing protein [Armatimonadota bacterium]
MLDKQGQGTHATPQSRQIRSESRALIEMLNLRSPNTGAPDGHSERVAVYAAAIGKQLDLSDKAMGDLRSAAILHDIGKVGISRQIVEKLGRLTEREFEIMRLHSTIAIRMLDRVEELKDALPMIKHHHERFDGKGYPDGTVGHDIPIGARIIAVAETFDMLVMELPWREAMSLKDALQELRRCSGTQFDPMIVDAFLALVESQKVEMPDELKEQMLQPKCRKAN